MRAKERASRQNQQPLPAHLDLVAGKASGPFEKHTHTIPQETRFSFPLSLGLKSCERQQPLSNPLPVSCFAIKPCSGSRPSATDPLHPNSNEIKVCSGVAERAPFFVKKSKAAAGRAWIFHTFGGTRKQRTGKSQAE